MDCTEAIFNNSSVETVRKLQVLLSLHDENTAIKQRIFVKVPNNSIENFHGECARSL